jgi:hypothetical protein
MDENWLKEAVLAKAREALTDRVEEAVIAAVGLDGRQRLSISIDIPDLEAARITLRRIGCDRTRSVRSVNSTWP